ncbi:MAG TPA: MFS transporter, partial [Fibrobacteria bacterium]|nr:MFS transporter [Fibrobacteria bacterium]
FERLGFSGLEVGLLVSAGFAAGILSPLLQVSVIRLFRGPRLPLLMALAGAALALGTLPLVTAFLPLLLHFFAFSFFASAIFPLNTACTLDAVRHRGHGAYFGIRSLGTLGFLAGCAVSVRYTGFSRLPALYLGFAGAYALALAVVAWDYPGRAAREAAAPRSGAGFARAFALLREGRTGKLLLVLGLMNFANGLALCVQGNYLTHRWAGGQASISQAWVVSTACEVPLFLLCAYVLRRYGLRYVLALGLAGTLVKILGVAAASELWQYFLALSMHGFFYSGALTGFSVHLDRSFDPADRPALQALSVVFFQGIPNALAGLAAGLVWHFSSLRSVYFLAGGVAVLVSLHGFRLLRHPTAGFRKEAAN